MALLENRNCLLIREESKMFDQNKVLQIIAYLLSLNKNKMNFLKLMKELYLIDRESIKERDTSVSGDAYFSLPHGPILSATKNLLDDLKSGEANGDNLFKGFLTVDKDTPNYSIYTVALKENPGYDLLSEKDIEYITIVSNRFKKYSLKKIEDFTHGLPEWTDPKSGNAKIRFQDIMGSLGKSKEEILIAKQEYNQIINLNRYIGE
jgi:hypothetical protein